MSPLKEYSTDDYLRKFKGTVCICDDKKQHSIYTLDSEFVWDKPDTDPIRASPLYYHFQPKYYIWGSKYTFLMRKNRKTFRVGLSQDSHVCYYYHPDQNQWISSTDALVKTDYLKPLAIDKQMSFKHYGPLNNTFFVDQRYVYCKIWPVALRKGTKIEVIIPEIEQEICDALRGVECQIN